MSTKKPSTAPVESVVTTKSTSFTPYYDKDGIAIYHGDCLELLPLIRLHKVDHVITSPPYNLGSGPWPHLGHWKHGDSTGGKSKWRNGSDGGNGVQYDTHKDAMPWDRYVQWQREVISGIIGFLPDNGALFYNHKPRVIGGRLWTPLELMPMNATIRQIVIWSRPGGMNFNPTAYLPTHEWIIVIANNGWRLTSRGASGLGDVWKMSPERNPHPAPFPLALPNNVFDTCDVKCVCDPFGGSGTTMVAARNYGLRGIMFEKSEAYCESAVKRLRQGVLF